MKIVLFDLQVENATLAELAKFEELGAVVDSYEDNGLCADIELPKKIKWQFCIR